MVVAAVGESFRENFGGDGSSGGGGAGGGSGVGAD